MKIKQTIVHAGTGKTVLTIVAEADSIPENETIVSDHDLCVPPFTSSINAPFGQEFRVSYTEVQDFKDKFKAHTDLTVDKAILGAITTPDTELPPSLAAYLKECDEHLAGCAVPPEYDWNDAPKWADSVVEIKTVDDMLYWHGGDMLEAICEDAIAFGSNKLHETDNITVLDKRPLVDLVPSTGAEVQDFKDKFKAHTDLTVDKAILGALAEQPPGRVEAAAITFTEQLAALIQKVYDNEAAFLAEFDLQETHHETVEEFYMADERCQVVVGRSVHPELGSTTTTIKTAHFLAWAGGLDNGK